MKILIVDSRISNKCERSLLKEGFSLIKIPPDKSLGEAIASHPDSVMFYHEGKIITTSDYCDDAAFIFSDIRELAPRVNLLFTSDKRKPTYPFDCMMNALVIGKRIFCRTDSISRAIIDHAKERELQIINTNQGYPACTVLAFGENAITADKGMKATLEAKGITVTLISQGGVSLPPHDYGFIGGASGVVGNKIYFFGDLSTHRDGELISEVIKRAGYLPVSLSDEPLIDLGGIIAL